MPIQSSHPTLVLRTAFSCGGEGERVPVSTTATACAVSTKQKQNHCSCFTSRGRTVRFDLNANQTYHLHHYQQQHQAEIDGLWYSDEELECMRLQFYQIARELLFNNKNQQQQSLATFAQGLLRRVYQESTLARTETYFDTQVPSLVRQKLAEGYEQTLELVGLERLFVGIVLQDCEERKCLILEQQQHQKKKQEQQPLSLQEAAASSPAKSTQCAATLSLPDCLFAQEIARACWNSLRAAE